MDTKKLVVFGFGQRGGIYASYADKNPEKFKLVAVIENNTERATHAKNLYPYTQVFTDVNDFLQAGICADIVAVATQDNQHVEHAILMMKNGFDLLLEKPIANKISDCYKIYNASIKYKRRVVVCHVLRYTPFYSTIKNIIKSGKLGEIITIDATENVGYFHQAHSFVRGPWRNKAQSCEMILAKCCHDMDIIRYLMDENCVSVNSYGGLAFFKEKNAPKGATKYCSDCPVKDCMYNAQKLYTADGKSWCANYFTTKEHTPENILADLKGTQYDRCVFKCDNDVVDHQVTIMQFENGKTCSHTMTAFSKTVYRDIKVYGTKAQLIGVDEESKIVINHFEKEQEVITVNTKQADIGGHNGGDYYLMENLYNELNGLETEGISYLDVSLESHLMSFAAEKSRLSNGATKKIRLKRMSK